MKITDVSILKVTGDSKAYPAMMRSRSSRSIDVYPEFDILNDHPNVPVARKSEPMSAEFLKIDTDSGIYGLYNISPSLSAGFIIITILRPLLLGRDPMATEQIWDIMSRQDRHARSGIHMIAISLVDICLWDIKGKALGLPLYKLLGGNRKQIDAYASMLGHSIDPEIAAQSALVKKNEGFKAQKWFFRWGLSHGEEGMQKNVDLVKHIRNAVGDTYQLMFDAWMSFNVSYTQELARRIEKYNVYWLEEPLAPRNFEGFIKLRDTINIPMSAGEHLYTRWEVKRWLDEGLLRVIQADPDWTGGISEIIKIANLCEIYDIPLVPHGHGVYAASGVVASQSIFTCPMAEVLLLGMERRQTFYKEGRMPLNGVITMPDTPGVGVEIDENKISSISEIFSEYKK